MSRVAGSPSTRRIRAAAIEIADALDETLAELGADVLDGIDPAEVAEEVGAIVCETRGLTGSAARRATEIGYGTWEEREYERQTRADG